MCLWHTERVSATNPSERGEMRGDALRGTQNAPQKAKLSEGRFGEAEPEGCASIRECGMAFGAHEPTRTRTLSAPVRANPYCRGAPMNAAWSEGSPKRTAAASSSSERHSDGISRVLARKHTRNHNT